MAEREHVDDVLVTNVLLYLCAEPHAKEHDGYNDSPLLYGVSEDIGGELAECVLVGHAAAAHDKHDEPDDESGDGAGTGLGFADGGVRGGIHR